MSIIYILIPIAILFVCIGLGIFFWAVRSRQFDDLDKEAYSILFDNEVKTTKPQTPDAGTTGAELADDRKIQVSPSADKEH